MRYPDARRLDLTETLHGRPVADPYRWLEDAADDECESWSQAQDALVRPFLDGLPGRQRLAQRLRALLPGDVSPPVVVGDRSFYLRRLPEQEFAVYCVDEGDGPRPLIDLAAIDPAGLTVLEAAVPSLDGSRVAYLLSEGGREDAVLHVLDVASGDDVAEPALLGRGGEVAWLAGDELAVVGRLPDDQLPAGEEQFHRRVWRHRIGQGRAGEALLFGAGRDKQTYYDIATSPDGRWLTVGCYIGTAPRSDVYVIDMQSGGVATVIEGVDAETSARVAFDGRLYVFTNLDAPRRRLLVASPASPADWRELVPESDDVLSGYVVTNDAVVVVRVHDVAARVTVHDKDTGAERAVVPLPGLGTAGLVARRDGGDEVWVDYTDFLTPATVYRYDVADGSFALWASPPGAVAVEGVSVRQVFVASKDGTRVPMFVIFSGAMEEPRPAVLYGYGGFDISLEPGYATTPLTWVEAGGVYAIANLRGGGEYGEDWHRAGMRQSKQNVFDDFAACAQWLIDTGVTTAGRLGIYGGSNGGLLVGAALTQRPDLFRAVVCSAPLLDMVRYELFGLGQTWNDEYGRADDPVEFEWLHSYSPYHHVTEGVAYPAVLFTVFEGDTRVDPLHARKLCAALQHATASAPDERPVLIRRETGVGHSARAVTRMVDLQTDVLSFLASQLGLAL
jgi:prolyl oligopeptidase